ncbi:MAG TPA: D-inositol-3-phosphate glycosyltransferase [Actinomycetota bacterium]|nr:D-inositol-3-phosphate glycosyltransferase [Actinomycetota bacterium]
MRHTGEAAPRIERVAVISMHTCPLDQPGTGDSGGMNVAVRSMASRLAELGVQVDLFTRASGPEQHIDSVDPGVRVVHLEAGPVEPIEKERLPDYLWPFLCGLLRFEAEEAARLGIDGPLYDLVHSHYWLSGWAGRLARDRLNVPLIHSFHTLGAVKNRALAPGDAPEPPLRIRGEEKIVQTADCLIAPTEIEAADLISLYGACPERIRVVSPGVDTDRFRPGVPDAAKASLGLAGRKVVLFVGRLQPLKRPDLAVRAVAELLRRREDLARDVTLVVVGGPSGRGGVSAQSLRELAVSLGVGANVEVRDPVAHVMLPDYYRAADVVVMPSMTESFGLVALEAQACGTPVVATDTGGLRAAVRNGTTGLLVPGSEPAAYARALERLLDDRPLRSTMGAAAARRARGLDWRRAAAAMLDVYEDVLMPAEIASPAP